MLEDLLRVYFARVLDRLTSRLITGRHHIRTVKLVSRRWRDTSEHLMDFGHDEFAVVHQMKQIDRRQAEPVDPTYQFCMVRAVWVGSQSELGAILEHMRAMRLFCSRIRTSHHPNRALVRWLFFYKEPQSYATLVERMPWLDRVVFFQSFRESEKNNLWVNEILSPFHVHFTYDERCNNLILQEDSDVWPL